MASTLQVDGAITSSAGAVITTADNSATLTLVSTDADANIGPELVLYRNSGSPADSDLLAEIDLRGRNDNSQDVDYVRFNAKITDASDGSEDGLLIIQTIEGGSQVSKVEFNSGATTFNQDGANVDFIVEGDADPNLFVVDANEDAVRIKTTNHYAALTIENDDAGAQERALYASVTASSGTSANNVALFSATDSNFTGSAVRIHLESPNADQKLIQCTTTGSNTEKFTVDEDGDVYVAGGIAVGGTGAANTLDDYEEGTWTPAFQSTNATFGYTTQGGNYTKVGRLIMLSFRLKLSGSPGGTTSNSVVVTGLPFNSATLADTYHGGMFGHYHGFNLSQTGVLAYQTATGAATVELKVVGDNLGETGVLASHLNSTAEIRGQIIYHTA